MPGLVHPQPYLGHQPGRRVVPRHRGELAARCQLAAPPGEQGRHLGSGRRDPQRRRAAAAGPVHRIDRALGHPSGQLVDLALMAELQELEVRLQRLRPSAARVLRRGAQRRAEVGVGVGGLHLPQRPAEPRPDLLQVHHIATGSLSRPTRRRPGQARNQRARRSRSPPALPGSPARASPAGPGPPPSPTCASTCSSRPHDDHWRRYGFTIPEERSTRRCGQPRWSELPAPARKRRDTTPSARRGTRG